MYDIKFRLEEEKDYEEVENLVRDSFWNVYRPGAIEHYLLNELRQHEDYVKDLAILMVKNDEIIGQVTFVKSHIETFDNKKIEVLTLGPIAIKKDYQKKGFGKKLLDYSLKRAKDLGYKVVALEGNINFYGKSGFDYGKNYYIFYDNVSFVEETPFFLLKELEEGFLDDIKGVYNISPAYFIDEEKIDDFDKNFPKKEKKILPGQIFS